MSWTSTATWQGPTRVEGAGAGHSGYLVRDDDSEPLLRVVERRLAEHQHIFLHGVGARRRARTSDAALAPVASGTKQVDPSDPKSGQQPASAGFVCDFRRDPRSGAWVGRDASGRRYRLLQSDNGAVFRVRSDEPEDGVRPPGVQPLRDARRRAVGDATLADPSGIHSEAEEHAALESWQEKIEQFWKRG